MNYTSTYAVWTRKILFLCGSMYGVFVPFRQLRVQTLSSLRTELMQSKGKVFNCTLPTVYLCVSYGSQNKEQLYLYTTLTNLSL
jgi:hypothetical protein